MSCPVIGEVAPAMNPDANVSNFVSAANVAQAEGLLQNVNKILPTCEIPALNLRKCQLRVAEGGEGAGNCVKQAECYLGCDKMVSMRKRQVMQACGDKLEGHVPAVHARFFMCLRNNDETSCLKSLQAFVDCGNETVAAK
mmetsp:Transcript_642/g.1595  ORF Transcript_642/g.1595 Transcript_642/m.1595 type:complete len:140 (+) Transcript_642:151-570(+)